MRVTRRLGAAGAAMRGRLSSVSRPARAGRSAPGAFDLAWKRPSGVEAAMLSETATTILRRIADGRSYEQILQQHPELTYFDIFAAAREALEHHESAARTDASPRPITPDAVRSAKHANAVVERAREKHARAYERWTADEDSRLEILFLAGTPPKQIARELSRQTSAIRSRLLKLGLFAEGQPPSVRESRHAQPPEPAFADRPVTEDLREGRPAVPGWERFRERLGDD